MTRPFPLGGSERPPTADASVNPAGAAVGAEVFGRLAVELHDAPTVEDTVDAVLAFALHALGCDYAGIALAGRAGRGDIAAVTDELVTKLVQLEVDNGAGPLIEALAALPSRRAVSVPDVATDLRWPSLAAGRRGGRFYNGLGAARAAGYGGRADRSAVAVLRQTLRVHQ